MWLAYTSSIQEHAASALVHTKREYYKTVLFSGGYLTAYPATKWDQKSKKKRTKRQKKIKQILMYGFFEFYNIKYGSKWERGAIACCLYYSNLCIYF